MEWKGSVRRIEIVHACKSEAAVGSKTCIGLTYLELGIVNVPWLRYVSCVRARVLCLAYQVGYHDLGLTAEGGGGCGGGGLGLPALLLGRLGNTAYRCGSGGRSSSAGGLATAAATARGLGGLEDVVEALLHLV